MRDVSRGTFEDDMERVYFTKEEAEALVGLAIEARLPFPSVPRGTVGKIEKAVVYAGDRYVVVVQWNVPRPSQLIDVTTLDFSFNFFRARKAVTDEFCKSEVEELAIVEG